MIYDDIHNSFFLFYFCSLQHWWFSFFSFHFYMLDLQFLEMENIF